MKLSKKQVDELLDMMDKEEVLELEDQIQKTLEKDAKKQQEEALATEEAIKVTSKSTVPATPVTKPDKKLGKEELEDDFTNPPKILKSSETTPPVSSSIPPSSKKAEGAKQL